MLFRSDPIPGQAADDDDDDPRLTIPLMWNKEMYRYQKRALVSIRGFRRVETLLLLWDLWKGNAAYFNVKITLHEYQ